MRPSLSIVLLLTLLAVSPVPAQNSKSTDKTRSKPRAGVPGYKQMTIHGFKLMINEEVFKNNDDPKWRRKPLEVLELELGTIVRRLPEKGVNVLRQLLLWIEWEDRSDPDLDKGVVAKYYGVSGNVVGWALGKAKHPGKANNVEVINMKSLTREHQPGIKFERCVLLHEMAHAVHHKLVGFASPNVKYAFEQARKRRLWDEAKDVYGRTVRPTYASTNDREYFAELTCAYLDKLHYEPFTPDKLKEHDPQGYKLMEQVWGTRKQLDRAIKARAEKDAGKKISQAELFWRTGKKSEAIEALELAIEEFPDTKAAGGAKTLLDRWKSEIEKK